MKFRANLIDAALNLAANLQIWQGKLKYYIKTYANFVMSITNAVRGVVWGGGGIIYLNTNFKVYFIYWYSIVKF